MSAAVLKQVSPAVAQGHNLEVRGAIAGASGAGSHLLHNAPLTRGAALEGTSSGEAVVGAFGTALGTRSVGTGRSARSGARACAGVRWCG